MLRIYFWQKMLTPHMTALALSLSRAGYDIYYIAEVSLSKDRLDLGWQIQNLEKIKVIYINNQNSVRSIIHDCPKNSIHICQGLRNNGIISFVQKELKKNNLRQWLIIETIRNSGISGFLRRLIYKIIISFKGKKIETVLAIGWKTTDLLIKLGFNSNKVFPFSYFLESTHHIAPKVNQNYTFRFIFVGSIVKGKNLDILIKALSQLQQYKYELIVVGDGPLKKSLQKYADKLIPNRIYWKGVIKMQEVSKFISDADCLVLPSKHDGWGAVASEAMISGVPAICTDECGVAEVVKLSNYGGVFESGNINQLINELKIVLENGKMNIHDRHRLSNWSKRITSDSGANYLTKIINFIDGSGKRPQTPWNES